MRYIIKIEGDCVVFDGIGKLKLEDVIISTDHGTFARADYVLAKYEHYENGKPLPK